jgi:hypothetical protein
MVCCVTSSGRERQLDAGDEGDWTCSENAPNRVLSGTSWPGGRMSTGREVNCRVSDGMLMSEKRVSCSAADVTRKRYDTSCPVAYGENSESLPDIDQAIIIIIIVVGLLIALVFTRIRK